MSNSEPHRKEWPESPYKGLAYYDSADQPLYTGRDREVDDVARLLDDGSTRILLLHGDTGRGKSSFLRAGLIPYLEEHRFKFLRLDNTEPKRSSPIFITSTKEPLGKLAENLFTYANLREATHVPEEFKQMGKTGFIEAVGSSPRNMINVLKGLASSRPKTLILIIDQAEEIITLWPENSKVEPKKSFFQFLFLFSGLKIDLKLILSLRTEFYGKFIGGLHPYTFDLQGFRDYYLEPLTDDELVEAIKRPTLDKPIPGYGRPRDKYGFCYEDGLVEQIANDLASISVLGGQLAVMQVICKRIYEATRKKAKSSTWVIKKTDYKALGNISNQLNSYIEETLIEKFEAEKESLQDALDLRLEIVRWKTVLNKLVDAHSDGTVTKRYETEDELTRFASELQCSLEPKDVLEFLSDATRQILRQEALPLLPFKSPLLPIEEERPEVESKTLQYTLAHDAIGLALRDWKISYDAIAGEKKHLGSGATTHNDLILSAAAYTREQLYDGVELGRRPQDRDFVAVNDFLWDHQVMGFAQHKKFFARLGIKMSFIPIRIDKERQYEKVEKLLERRPETVLFCFPRVLLSPKARHRSFDFAISNVFTGYSLISRASQQRRFDPACPRDTFKLAYEELSTLKIAAEDEGAKQFAEHILTNIYRIITKNQSAPPPALSVHLERGGREILFDKLYNGVTDLIVGTAPSRAYARQLAYPVYLDSNDVLRLVDYVRFAVQGEGTLLRELKEIDSSLVLHNCWHFNLGGDRSESGREVSPLTLRLASIALFTSRYIKRAPEEFISYLQQLNRKVMRQYIDPRILRETFEECYDFSLNENYFDSYMDRSSRYYYDLEPSGVTKNGGGVPNTQRVYRELQSLRQQYYRFSEQVDNLIHTGTAEGSEARKRAEELKTRARHHYHIYNYYDAVSILQQLNQTLNAAHLSTDVYLP